MRLKGIIPGIVFKLDMQFEAYSAILTERTTSNQTTKYYFYYAHMQLQRYEDTGNKIA